MRFTLFITTIVISVCSAAVAFPSLIINPPSEALFQRDDDIVYSGNYAIKGCGSQAPAVKDLLNRTYYLLRQAMDLLPGPVGNGGGFDVYDAFFNGVDPATVKALYRRMTAGTSITIEGKSYHPTIVCVADDKSSSLMRATWDNCAAKQGGGQNIGMTALGTPYMFFCPIWTGLAPIPLPYMCGTVGRLNTLTTPVNLSTTKYTNLVHLLAILYLGPDVLKPSVLLPNDCIALPPDKSVKNAQNYAFYVGCKHVPSLCQTYFHSN